MDIREIALIVRQELRHLIKRNPESFDENYGKACAVSSWLLNEVLNSCGIKSEFVIGHWENNIHAYCLVEDCVVDITATQFGQPEVVIEKFEDSKYDYPAKPLDEWPEDQQPRCYRMSRIKKRCLDRIDRLIMEAAA